MGAAPAEGNEPGPVLYCAHCAPAVQSLMVWSYITCEGEREASLGAARYQAVCQRCGMGERWTRGEQRAVRGSDDAA